MCSQIIKILIHYPQLNYLLIYYLSTYCTSNVKQTVYKLKINRHFVLWRREAITNSYFCWYFNETQDVKITKIVFVLLLLTLISCLYDLSFWKIRRQTSRDFQISSRSFQLSKNMCLVWRRRWSASKIFMRWGEDFVDL